jgi:prepilin-type N-terminal cleavage/methylation domain-containing protein
MMRQVVSHPLLAPTFRRGFTLIEAAIVTVIVGVGVVAMLQLLASGTMANTESTELTTAMNLAGNIHEMSLGISYKNIMTLDGKNFSPPIDGQLTFNTATPPAVTSYGNSISTLTNWKQAITVNYVDHNKITLTVPKTQLEPTARISVTVSHGTRPVYTTSWIVSAAEWPLP